MKEFKCQNCGKVFEDYPSKNPKYCSKECYHEAQRRPDKLEIECYHCGKKGTAYWDVDRRKRGPGWSAEGFRGFSKVDGRDKRRKRWLCNECDEFRCERCDVLLSKDFYKKRILSKMNNEAEKEKAKEEFENGERINYGYYTEESLPFCRHCYQELKGQNKS